MTASSRQYGFRSAMTSSTRPAFSWSLIVFIQSSCSLSHCVTAFTAASAYWRAWNRSMMKVIFHPTRISFYTARVQGASVKDFIALHVNRHATTSLPGHDRPSRLTPIR